MYLYAFVGFKAWENSCLVHHPTKLAILDCLMFCFILKLVYALILSNKGLITVNYTIKLKSCFKNDIN